MKLDLYIKTWCPWCVRAMSTLDQLGYSYTVHDVESDTGAFAKMLQISGQSRTPTLQVGAHVLADFGPEELQPFLAKHGITAS